MSQSATPGFLGIAATPRRSLAVAAALALVAPAAWGMWAILPEQVPVDRLLKNANRYIEAHPKDARGYYVLGRLHSMAFATGAAELFVANPEGRAKAKEVADAPARFLPWEPIQAPRHKRPTTPAPARSPSRIDPTLSQGDRAGRGRCTGLARAGLGHGGGIGPR